MSLEQVHTSAAIAEQEAKSRVAELQHMCQARLAGLLTCIAEQEREGAENLQVCASGPPVLPLETSDAGDGMETHGGSTRSSCCLHCRRRGNGRP